MVKSITEWLQGVAALALLLGSAVGIYGSYAAELAVRDSKIKQIEVSQDILNSNVKEIGREVHSIRLVSGKNLEKIEQIKRDQAKFDKVFIKFTEAVNRLSISVAKLEERLRLTDQ